MTWLLFSLGGDAVSVCAFVAVCACFALVPLQGRDVPGEVGAVDLHGRRAEGIRCADRYVLR